MTRLGPNEEEDVHKLVLRTFTDLFFAPNADDASAALPAAECASRCDMFVAVVAKTSASGGNGAQRCEWLGGVLRKMLSPEPEASKATLREAAAAEKLCHQLVGQLMEALLQLEERAGESPDQLALKCEKMGHALHALSLFCAAQPSLLVPHIDVLAQFLNYEHATTAVGHICEMLPPLLHILDHPPNKLMTTLEKLTSALVFKVKEALLPSAIAALAATIRTSGNASLIVTILARFDSFLERYLKGLAKPAAFLRTDVGRLVTITATGSVSISSNGKEAVKKWFDREVDWAGNPPHKCSQEEILDVDETIGGTVTLASGATFRSPNPGVKAASAYRAMLSAGLLCQYYDFDSPLAVAQGQTDGGQPLVLSGAKLGANVHKKLSSLAQPHRPPMTILYAYKGLGQVTARKPQLLLENVDLIGRALKKDALASLKRQALTNLQMQLSADEDRQRSMGASNASAGGAGRAKSYHDMHAASETSAAVTGALQHHLPAILEAMLDPHDVSVRHAALTLIGSMLSAGLAHPAAILPKVLALEVDQGPGGCAEVAMGELRRQYERHKEMLSAPSIAVEGAKEAFKLYAASAQAATAAAASSTSATSAPVMPASRFTFIYNLHSASRKPRTGYLRAVRVQDSHRALFNSPRSLHS